MAWATTRFARIAILALFVLTLTVGVMIASSNRDRAEAANYCQHYTHQHYHFPYAHYDTHRYDGTHQHSGGYHYHHYNNLQHADEPYYDKKCDVAP